MGTRHLIVVQCDDKIKVAQYGQWDGYPSGQGKTILEFLKTTDLESFKERVRKLNWLTKKQAKEVDDTPDWNEAYPYLSRDAGAQVLYAIMGEMEVSAGYGKKEKKKNIKVIGLTNGIGFSGDSLFCEWAYVINLDTSELEVYRGFNKEPLTESDRFFKYTTHEDRRGEDQYYPVKLIKKYSFSELPTQEEFLNQLKEVQ